LITSKNQFNFFSSSSFFRSETICTYANQNSISIYLANHNSKEKYTEEKKIHSRRCLTIFNHLPPKFCNTYPFLYQVNTIVHHHHLSFHDKTWSEISIYSSQHPVLYCNWSWQVHSKFTCKFPIRMLIRNIQSSKVTPQTQFIHHAKLYFKFMASYNIYINECIKDIIYI